MRWMKITRSHLHEAYVLSISLDDGNTWEIYDMYPYGGVPTEHNREYDEDSVSADILFVIARLVNDDNFIFATKDIEDVD